MSEAGGKLTLWGVEVFLAVAEEGTVSMAARRLGASASSVSQQISNLENALEVELLNRRARPMSLTTAGQVFRKRAQKIMLEAQRARSELAGLDLSHLGQLRLGVVEDFENAVTPKLISAMAGRLEATRFTLETDASHRLIDRLETRDLDVVVATELGSLAEWCERLALLDDPFVAIVPKGQNAIPEDLPFLQYTRRHAIGRLLTDHLSNQGMQLSGRFELDSYRAILAMVAAGSGWTILSALGVMSAGRYQADVDILPLPVAALSRRISLLTRKDGVADMAPEIAKELRPLLDAHAVAPMIKRCEWLAPLFKVLP